MCGLSWLHSRFRSSPLGVRWAQGAGWPPSPVSKPGLGRRLVAFARRRVDDKTRRTKIWTVRARTFAERPVGTMDLSCLHASVMIGRIPEVTFGKRERRWRDWSSFLCRVQEPPRQFPCPSRRATRFLSVTGDSKARNRSHRPFRAHLRSVRSMMRAVVVRKEARINPTSACGGMA